MEETSLASAQRKANDCEPLTHDELELLRASEPVLTAEDLTRDTNITWEEEEAYLLGETPVDPFTAR